MGIDVERCLAREFPGVRVIVGVSVVVLVGFLELWPTVSFELAEEHPIGTYFYPA